MNIIKWSNRNEKNILSLLACLAFVFVFISCSKKSNITLIGESHHIKEIQDKELELYRDFYEKGGRHLFVEHGYPYASIMNMIMEQYDSFEVMLSRDRLEDDFDFYQYIKDNFPETIFHGIDVEKTNLGEPWLQYVQENNFGTEEEYNILIESIENAKKFRSFNVEAEKYGYREGVMTKNFIREYKKVKGQPIFGIFGSAHTNKKDTYIKGIPTMGMNLEKKGLHYEVIKLDNVAELMRN